MRWQLVVCVFAIGCASTEKIAGLETRVTALETRAPVEATPALRSTAEPRLEELEARVRELEATVDRLQAQLDEAPTSAPAPAPAPALGAGVLDPAVAYPVPVDDSPATGPADAAVTIVAAVQFPEPYTHRAWPVLKALRKHYGKDLRIVFKSFIVHPTAKTSSIAACAAARQGRLDAMEGAIFAAAEEPPPMGAPSHGLRELDEAELRELARVLRLDLKQYDRDLAGCAAGQTRDVAMFHQLGQRGVPTFWINGRPLSGAQPIESFKSVIDVELDKAKQYRARGGKAADYYKQLTRP